MNYHHLLYFWTVAREGSVVKAAEKLFLSQPTISAQIKALEDNLGEKLFLRSGRKLQLTEAGETVARYAEDIFSLGRELRETLRGRPTGREPVLAVGIADVVPKMVAYRLLAPLLESDRPTRLICREDKTDALFLAMASHQLDVLLTDAPAATGSAVKSFNHFLGESGMSFFAVPALAKKCQKNFPQSLDKTPFILPTENTMQRRSLAEWFDKLGIRPKTVAEFEDSALIKIFGKHGAGVFCVPTCVESEVMAQYGVKLVGRTEEVKERFYAISPERKIKHPAVAHIYEAARDRLFGTGGGSAAG